MILGDQETVFGELDTEQEALPPEYRSHGSLHEMALPLVIHNAEVELQAVEFRYNWDLAKWVYKDGAEGRL